ncbi:MAG: hypothetical protein E6Q40_04540 [Cupriavidus sp.]|nr:MAG: hypothetical protein E6Q40_04540 [Cupriavidus sp.]
MASTITALVVQGETVLPDGSDAAVPNGWVAAATLPDDGSSTFDPTKIVLTVTDPGYDGSGTTTVTRTIRGTAIVRKQYPNQAQRLNSAASGTRTVYFALDDEIYSGSTITAANAEAGYYGAAAAGSIAGVTNSSTLAYPKPLFAWLNTQHERATGSAFNIEAVAYHRHGRNGQMVARIEFQAKDAQGTPNLSAVQTVTAPALSSIQTQGPIVEAWKASIPLTALTQADLCLVGAKVYPWIGDSSAVLDLFVDGISTSGAVATAQTQTPLRFVCDKTGGYGGAYAYVKSGASGGTVSTTAATARAAPFATIAAAFTALKTFNNANKSHNDHSGAIIRLMDDGAGGAVAHAAGDHDTVTAGLCWTVIEPDPSNTAAVSVSVATNYPADLSMWKVNITQTGRFDGTNTAGKRLAFAGMTLTISGASVPINYRNAYAYFQNVTISGDISATNGFVPYGGGTKAGVSLMLGMIATGAAGDWRISPQAVIGCSFIGGRFEATDLAGNTGMEAQDGAVIANNLFRSTSRYCAFEGQAIVRGLAVVQNVIERAVVSSAQPALQIAGDGSSTACANLVLAHNSMPGVDTSGRTNILYTTLAASVGVPRTGTVRFNLFSEYNMKTDTFTSTTTLTGRTGNWKARYQVGFRGNVGIRGDTNGVSSVDPSGSNWLGEALGVGCAYGQTTISFLDDKSGASGAGGGDYRLTGSSNPAYSRVPAGLAMLAYDLRGAVRRNNGSGAAGAFENEQPIVSTGGLAATLGAIQFAAAGAVANPPIVGAAAITLGAVTLAADADVIVKGSLGSVLGSISIAAAASVIGGAITARGEILAGPDRTIVPTTVPSGSSRLTESASAYAWAAIFDPADRAPYAFDWSDLLDDGEQIASIQDIRMSAAGAALGVEIDISSGRSPIIEADIGRRTQLWFLVAASFQGNPAFADSGMGVAVTMRVRTDGSPYKEYERTGVLAVRQL